MNGVDLILDVDGVFNAYPPLSSRNLVAPGWRALDWGWECEPVEVDVIGFPITYSTALVERINALVGRPEVTPYWLTTWCEQAPVALCPAIGLNGAEWPVLGVPQRFDRRITGWWKHPAIRLHVEATLAVDPGRRFVWVDDDLAFDDDAKDWVVELNTLAAVMLGIAPATHNGLTLDHLDMVERWIETGEVLA